MKQLFKEDHMKLPVGLTRATLELAIREYTQQNFYNDIDVLRCKKCHRKVSVVQGHASIHFGRYDTSRTCGGGGDVEEVIFPHCTACEGKLKDADTYTCIHTQSPRLKSGDYFRVIADGTRPQRWGLVLPRGSALVMTSNQMTNAPYHVALEDDVPEDAHSMFPDVEAPLEVRFALRSTAIALGLEKTE